MNTAMALGTEIQKIIDYRLDSLDRLLIGSSVSRSERMDVVQSVEDQIHEMMDRRSDGEPTREDVVQVLRELDPPEAYVSDWMQQNELNSNLATEAVRFAKPNASRKHSPLAITAFVLALFSVPLIIIFPIGLIFAFAGYICATVCLVTRRCRDDKKWMPIATQTIFALYSLFCLMMLSM